jgi:hypothetical protein
VLVPEPIILNFLQLRKLNRMIRYPHRRSREFRALCPRPERPG